MSSPDLTSSTLRWRKSARSAQGNENCVEIADAGSAVIAVRDSKNPDGPRLAFARREMSDLAARIRSGEHDL